MSWSTLRGAALLNALWLLAACAGGVAPTPSPSPTAVPSPTTSTPAPPRSSIALAAPDVAFAGSRQEKTSDGRYQYVAYVLEVTNRSSYPGELFTSMLGAPGCGDDNGLSRARIDVYDGASNMILVTLCGLSGADAMNEVVLRYPPDQTPPASVYLSIADRATGAMATSEPVSIIPWSSSLPSAAPSVSPVPTASPSPSFNTTGDGWTRPLQISSIAGLGASDLVVDAAGHVHILGTQFRWLDEDLGQWTNRVEYLSNASGTWQREHVSNEGAYRGLSMSVDAAGNVAVAYNGTSGSDCTGCEDGPVYVAVKRDDHWGAPQIVGAAQFGDPSVAIADGVVRVVYQWLGYECWIGEDDEAHPGPDCGTQYATDASGAWAAEQIDPYVYGEPALSLSSSGSAWIAFISADGLTLASAASTGTFEIENVPLQPAIDDTTALQVLVGAGSSPVIVTSELVYSQAGGTDGLRHRIVRQLDGGWIADTLALHLPRARSVLNASGEVQSIAWDLNDEGTPGLWFEAEGVGSPVQIGTGLVGGADLAIDTTGVLYALYTNEDGIWLRTRPPDGL